MITGNWNIKPESFLGASGKVYFKNPMGDKYGFTTYSGYPVSMSNWIGATTAAKAYADAKDVPDKKEKWKVASPAGTQVIECLDTGETEDGDITEIIESLIQQYGFEKVTATCLTTTH